MTMKILLSLYNKRSDLQKAFPEVTNGDIRRLLEWALSCGIQIDSAKFILRPIEPELRELLNDISIKLKNKGVLINPPEEMINGIGGAYNSVGNEFFKYFKDLCDLKPDERVLDVGCGVGRMAMPLTSYLNNNGCYEGFDIVADWINWCQENISKKFPNFNFSLADVYNKEYNCKGKWNAADYIFPYKSDSFNFVFLTSVFTHMLPLDLENYLSEVSRVLKKRGKCLITYFLINSESSSFIRAKSGSFNFEYSPNGFYTTNKKNPEAAIAYDERIIRELHDKYRLDIMEPIYYGSWCGRQKSLSAQDITISIKR